MARAVTYAQKVLEKYWDKQLPVQPTKVIENITASQVEPDLIYVVEPMPDDISGQLTFDHDKQTYIIKVNSTKPISHQRFTLAHELGHYAMSHGDKHDNKVTLFRNGQSDPDEVEANAFAAELLMPTVLVKKMIFEKSVTTIESLAMIFDVSEQAMMYRLKNLGLLR